MEVPLLPLGDARPTVAVALNGVPLPAAITGDRLHARSKRLSAGSVAIRVDGGAPGAVVLGVEVAPAL
jgi:hypothetical protein